MDQNIPRSGSIQAFVDHFVCDTWFGVGHFAFAHIRPLVCDRDVRQRCISISIQIDADAGIGRHYIAGDTKIPDNHWHIACVDGVGLVRSGAVDLCCARVFRIDCENVRRLSGRICV